MNLLSFPLNPAETETVLGTVLRTVEGDHARLERWTACPLSKRGRRRTVRYDLDVRIPSEPRLRHCQWVGKYYERNDDVRRVAGVLRELTGCDARGGPVIPAVVGWHSKCRLLLMTYERGESVIRAIARDGSLILEAIGRALAVLHATPAGFDGSTSASDVLAGLRRRVAHLCARFPGAAVSLRQILDKLVRQAPCGPVAPAFLHGDLGPAQLLWQSGRVILLDFDRCTRGDPGLDLGNFLTQLRRLTLRKPGKLPDFVSLRRGILEAYRRHAPPDPGLDGRVAWYERVILVRKIHFLASDTTRHEDAEEGRRREAEAAGLLEALPALVEGA